MSGWVTRIADDEAVPHRADAQPDQSLEIPVFSATEGTGPVEDQQPFSCLVQLAQLDPHLAEVFVRSAMHRFESQRLLIVVLRASEASEAPRGVAEIVHHVGMRTEHSRQLAKFLDRLLELPGVDELDCTQIRHLRFFDVLEEQAMLIATDGVGFNGLPGIDRRSQIRMRLEECRGTGLVASLLERLEVSELTLSVFLLAEGEIRNAQLLIRRVHLIVVANGLLQIAGGPLVLALTLIRHATHVVGFGVARDGFQDFPKFSFGLFAFPIGQ